MLAAEVAVKTLMFVGVGASVTGDTPVLVRQGGVTRLASIAEVVDAHYADGQEGFPIAVEGLDGSGKSTQIYLIKRWLELQRCRVYFTEWNSSVLVRKATSKGKKRQLLTPTTFCLIHATDFADRYERQILPLLRAGRGPVFAAIKISDKQDPMVLPVRDGVYIKHRFRDALLGPEALK